MVLDRRILARSLYEKTFSCLTRRETSQVQCKDAEGETETRTRHLERVSSTMSAGVVVETVLSAKLGSRKEVKEALP